MESSTISLIFSFITAATMATVVAAVDPAKQNSPQDFLDAHNRARAEVGVQPLVWNDTVAKYALQYAQKHYGDCEMEHSMGPYGENLAEGLGRLSAVDAVGMWVSEKSCYDYNSNSCVGGECLHYTQVVWRDSTHLGCARLQCRNDWLFVICNYDPPGNYIGQRPY
ncbi:pathogenesis-related protein-1-like protein [Perilla frutescens var. hirtella]|uniref:Pathogenesis-related protein-1-like protein n=1 Tax=Perilla frutescens var. hirtella TaxID=608512 RepID=A0AAD4P2D9_PERFH|nr:pathogenesis-related protein-1-like protein [Perilla frutescens var. hirtella]KAH6823600.1 pathogenesis-related protein-1-like protein [Perilla frutescens var. hirtella]